MMETAGTLLPLYTLPQYLCFFFLYSILGWCTEVAFAAVNTRQLVNRGFLNGPLCPIYGCGMVALLAVLGPWQSSIPAVFVTAAVLATLVELIAGYALYKLFHTRWWDYTQFRGNLGGFICPRFSLLWGLGGIVMIKLVHPLVAGAVLSIPATALNIADGVLLVGFAVDVGISFAQAAGLERRLRRLKDFSAAMRRLSDAMTEAIGTRAMTFDTLLDEQKLQLMLAAMEGRENAAPLREQLLDMADRARTVRAEVERLAMQKHFGEGRLLRAFPHMKASSYDEVLGRLRAATARLARTARNLKDMVSGL